MNEDYRPLVSVVIPAYNAARYIGDTLKSVTGQTYRNIEVIVVDDSSNDNTKEIVEVSAREDRRIKYHLIDHSGLPAVPRNFGINAAKGELVAFLDADDIWPTKKLEEQIGFLQKNSNLVFVYSMSVTFGEVSIFSPYYEVLPLLHKAARSRDDLIKKGNAVSCSTVLVRTDLLKKSGGFDEDPKLKAVEDYDLWLRLSELGRFGFIPKIHAYYRVHKTQSSSDWQTKQKRLAYLAKKRSLPLPPYKFYRNKGTVMMIVRNLVHFATYLKVRYFSS